VTQEAEIRRFMVEGQPREKVSETPSQSIIQEWCLTPLIPAIQKAWVGGSQSEAGHGQKCETVFEK
jgi:hypothetical protein